MAINTQSRRRSVLGYGGPSAIVRPVPDGAITMADRAQVAGLYPGLTYTAAVVFVAAPPEDTYTPLRGSRVYRPDAPDLVYTPLRQSRIYRPPQ